VTRGTVSTAAVRFVLAALDRVGADAGALARRAGLPVWALGDNTARISRGQLASVLRLAGAELADPGLGSHLGCQWRFGALHLYDYLFGTAATLGEALAVGYRFVGIVTGADGAEIGLVEDDGRMTVVHRARYAVDPPRCTWGWQPPLPLIIVSWPRCSVRGGLILGRAVPR